MWVMVGRHCRFSSGQNLIQNRKLQIRREGENETLSVWNSQGQMEDLSKRKKHLLWFYGIYIEIHRSSQYVQNEDWGERKPGCIAWCRA
jgi:hypothetical protein